MVVRLDERAVVVMSNPTDTMLAAEIQPLEQVFREQLKSTAACLSDNTIVPLRRIEISGACESSSSNATADS